MTTAPYTIRPATAADAETIKQIVRANPLDPNAVDWHYFLLLELIEAGKPIIASIGMVRPAGEPETEGGSTQELDSVATLPQYRRRGYAEAVVRALIARTPAPIYLLAETGLIGYYQRLGFRLMEADAPPVMRDQAEWVNRMFGDYATYHVMGNARAVRD